MIMVTATYLTLRTSSTFLLSLPRYFWGISLELQLKKPTSVHLDRSCSSRTRYVSQPLLSVCAMSSSAATPGNSTRTTPKTSPLENEKGQKDGRIVWVDLEMSGLDLNVHTIIEMACIVTDSDLNIVAEAPNLIIHHPTEVRDDASDWCKEHFEKSGLWKEVEDSRINLEQAEDIMVKFLEEHILPKKSPLAGNSVYIDRRYLEKYMPKFDALLHYRIIDVSTIKELSRRWYLENHYHQPKKQASHRALADIKESIEELRWYRSNVFREQTVQPP